MEALTSSTVAGDTVHIEGTHYRLARFSDSNIAALLPLYRTVFRKDPGRDWLSKKYSTDYIGIRDLGYIAFTEDGDAVSSFGMLAWPMRFGDRTELAGQAMDVMTHPQHQRRGLFSILGEKTTTLCESEGLSFVYAFPNQESLPGFLNRLGYIHLGNLAQYRLPVTTFPLERIARRLGMANGLYRRYTQRLLRRYPLTATLENSVLSNGFAGTNRDEAFFNYKTFAGSRVHDIDGCRVWLKIARGIMIGDIENKPEPDLERALRAIKGRAFRLGIDQILFQISEDTRLSRFFADRFTSLSPLAIVYRNFRSEIPPGKLKFTFGDLDNF